MSGDSFYTNNWSMANGLRCDVTHNNAVKVTPLGISSNPSLVYTLDDGLGREAVFSAGYGSRCLTLARHPEGIESADRFSSTENQEFFKNCFISLLALGFERFDTEDGDEIRVFNFGIDADEIVGFLVLEKQMQESRLTNAH